MVTAAYLYMSCPSILRPTFYYMSYDVLKKFYEKEICAAKKGCNFMSQVPVT